VRRICGHKLRQEGEEEQRHLRIERVGQRALPEYAAQGDGIAWKGDISDRGRARAQYLDAREQA
jgi:hypothetical protein